MLLWKSPCSEICSIGITIKWRKSDKRDFLLWSGRQIGWSRDNERKTREDVTFPFPSFPPRRRLQQIMTKRRKKIVATSHQSPLMLLFLISTSASQPSLIFCHLLHFVFWWTVFRLLCSKWSLKCPLYCGAVFSEWSWVTLPIGMSAWNLGKRHFINTRPPRCKELLMEATIRGSIGPLQCLFIY